MLTQGPIVTAYETLGKFGEASEGVTTPMLLTAGFPLQVPPEGLAVKLNGNPFVQKAEDGLIIGDIVSETEITRLLVAGQTVGLGFELVL